MVAEVKMKEQIVII